MIREKEKFLTQVYAAFDLMFIFISFIFTWWLKFDSQFINVEAHLAFKTYFYWTIIYGILSIVIGFFTKLYVPKRKKRFSYEVFKIIQVHSISMLSLLSVLFAFKEIHFSRLFLLIFVTMNIMLIVIYRYTVKLSLKHLRKKGYNIQFQLVLGAGSLGRKYYETVLENPSLGFEVIGFLDDYITHHGKKYKDYKPILGKVDNLEFILQDHLIDEIIIALPLYAHEKYKNIINTCEKAGVKTLIIPDFYDFLPARPYIDNIADIPLINIRDIPLEELTNRFLKRSFDILFSLFSILLTLPIMLIIALLIKLTSKGPIIFKQERVGLNRRNFHMYKFRTMKHLSKKSSDTEWTTKDDDRKTIIGSFLRKTSLDELPQFFNVLLGNMSVVGPRPERPFFVEQFKEQIPKYMIKHHIRPGITGYAQINGLRGDTSIKERIKHDIYYIENWTFLFDLKIIIKTIIDGFVNKNAY